MAPASFAIVTPDSYALYPDPDYSSDSFAPQSYYPIDSSVYSQYKNTLQQLFKQMLETYLDAQSAYDAKYFNQRGVQNIQDLYKKRAEFINEQQKLNSLYNKFSNLANNYVNYLNGEILYTPTLETQVL